MRTNGAVFISVFSLLVLCPCTEPASSDNTENQIESSHRQIEATIIALERRLWDADVSRDSAPSRELVADDFEGIKHGLRYNMQDDGAVANQYKLQSYSMSDTRVRLVRPGVALITYRVTWTGSFAGIQLPQQPFYNASLWTKRVGRWKNTFAAETQPDFATKVYMELSSRARRDSSRCIHEFTFCPPWKITIDKSYDLNADLLHCAQYTHAAGGGFNSR